MATSAPEPVPTEADAGSPARCAGVFSIDLEDFAQISCRNATGILPEVTSDIDRATDVVLTTLAECDVRATFFVLGMVASRRPDLVRKVHAAGHEIATHGSDHIPAFRQTPGQFEADVGDSIKLLEDITGQAVLGYRAPAFSIVRQTIWALDVLAQLGLRYDSSIFPMRLRRYGIDGFDPLPHLYELPAGGRIVEIPLLVWQWRRRRFPISGGGYLRLMPELVLRKVVSAIGRAGQWFTLYLHPYEFDPEPLDVGRAIPPGQHMPALKRRLLNAKWNLRRGTILAKVRWLCRNVRFSTYMELARQVSTREQPRAVDAV